MPQKKVSLVKELQLLPVSRHSRCFTDKLDSRQLKDYHSALDYYNSLLLDNRPKKDSIIEVLSKHLGVPVSLSTFSADLKRRLQCLASLKKSKG